MMRMQLRSFYSPCQRAEIYASRYDHSRWDDHVLRIRHTAGLLRGMNPSSVADLSCGDGAIVREAGLTCPVYLGDLTPGWGYAGPIEETIFQIPQVDVFVCSETLEHVEDPDGLLAAIRRKASRLLLSTPDGESDSSNPEHYWGWDTEGVGSMLAAAGWTDRQEESYTPPVKNPYYTFQIWRCR